MTRKQNTLISTGCLITGIIIGIIGKSYTIGVEHQKIKDDIIKNESRIIMVETKQDEYKKRTTDEMNRYANIIATQISGLQEDIKKLTSITSELRTDVQVLKALIERMEKGFNKTIN